MACRRLVDARRSGLSPCYVATRKTKRLAERALLAGPLAPFLETSLRAAVTPAATVSVLISGQVPRRQRTAENDPLVGLAVIPIFSLHVAPTPRPAARRPRPRRHRKIRGLALGRPLAYVLVRPS